MPLQTQSTLDVCLLHVLRFRMNEAMALHGGSPLQPKQRWFAHLKKSSRRIPITLTLILSQVRLKAVCPALVQSMQ